MNQDPLPCQPSNWSSTLSETIRSKRGRSDCTSWICGGRTTEHGGAGPGVSAKAKKEPRELRNAPQDLTSFIRAFPPGTRRLKPGSGSSWKSCRQANAFQPRSATPLHPTGSPSRSAAAGLLPQVPLPTQRLSFHLMQASRTWSSSDQLVTVTFTSQLQRSTRSQLSIEHLHLHVV